MKRNIYRFISLLLVLGLVATGCGQTSQKQEDAILDKVESEADNGKEKFDTEVEDTANESEDADDSETLEEVGQEDDTAQEDGSSQDESNQDSSYSDYKPEEEEDKDSVVVGEASLDNLKEPETGSSETEVLRLAKKVVGKIITTGMTEFEKAKAIHDYLVINVDYDYENYLNNTIPRARYTAEGALRDGYAVCAGYALAFKLLCEQAGMECDYVVGSAGGYHAWNQVKVDGKWYNVDVTWDDPVSKGKAFDDHSHNRYSYFLISDELMNKDHKAHNAKHTCPSSLNEKAYEVGAPWATTSYRLVKNEEELIAEVKKMIDANETSLSITWDKNWVAVHDMGSKISGLMKEFVSPDCFWVSKYSYITIPNTTLYSATFTIELKNGSYEKIDKLCSIDDIKALVIELEKGFPYEKTVPMANEIVNDDIFYEVAVWAWEERDVTVSIHVSQVTINSTTSSVLVHVNKNTYFDDYHANTAYRIKTLAQIKPLLEERHAISASFRVIYRYGDELGRLSKEELTNYIEQNLAPGWASGYCFESYELSCDDFTCVVSITFYNARHSSQGSSWEYEKEPTCIESGLMVLRCSKCGKVTGSHEVEATGVHTYRWNYENESTRTPTCIHCSHVGKTEICLDGVWGYYDTEKALAFVEKINQERANTRKGVVDDWGNCVGVITPPPLTIDTSLNQKAETRVIQLMLSDFKNTVDDEAYYRSIYYENTKQVKGYAGGIDWCDEKYTRIGVSCFCVDRDNSGLNFLDQYAFEFGE